MNSRRTTKFREVKKKKRFIILSQTNILLEPETKRQKNNTAVEEYYSKYSIEDLDLIPPALQFSITKRSKVETR